MMNSVAVFCGSSTGFNPIYLQEAERLGRTLSKKKIQLVYGGGKIGMMGVLADAVLETNGSVIGVIPGLLRHEEVAHDQLQSLLVTKTMSKRKVKISKLVDGYIAMPGGLGTCDELFEALTLSQLGIEQKPVGLLNINGYFDLLLKQVDHMIEEGFLKSAHKELIITSTSSEELIDLMLTYNPPKRNPITHKIVQR